MKSINKNDVILIFSLLLAAILFTLIRSLAKQDGGKAVVYVNNQVYCEHTLDENSIIDIYDNDKIINTIEIADGYVSMTYATCPDKLCLKQQRIANGKEAICCLPNKVYIEIESTDMMKYDAITE